MKKIAMKCLAALLAFVLALPMAALAASDDEWVPLSDFISLTYTYDEETGWVGYGDNGDGFYLEEIGGIYRDGEVLLPRSMLDASAESRRFVRLADFVESYAHNEETGFVSFITPDGEEGGFYFDEIGAEFSSGDILIPVEAAGDLLGFAFGWSEMEMEMDVPERVERLDLAIWNPENFAETRDPLADAGAGHGEIALAYIRHMSDNLPGRVPFSYGELEAAIWLVEELLAMGHDFDNIEVQEFTFWDLVDIGHWPWWGSLSIRSFGGGIMGDGFLREDRVSQNVVLTLPGQGDGIIVVGAHYDSLIYPGASDNASGSALLLESAMRMLELENYHTVMYVFFGAEEIGLLGAHWFYQQLSDEQLDSLLLMVNADVLIEGPHMLFGAGGMPSLSDVEDMGALRESFMEAWALQIAEWHLETPEYQDFSVEELEEILAEGIFPGDGEYADWNEMLDDIVGPDLWELDESGESVRVFRGELDEAGLSANMEWLADMPDDVIFNLALEFGILEARADPMGLLVSELAAALNEEHGDFELIEIPAAVNLPSDQLVFLHRGHTVAVFTGMESLEGAEGAPNAMRFFGEFATTVLHTESDEFGFIEDRWPGMMLANMRGFGLLLEGILTWRPE